MATTRFPNDVHVDGRLSANLLVPSNSSIGNGQMNPADPIDTDKTLHRYQAKYSQGGHAVTAITKREVLHVARAAGNLVDFCGGCTVACIGAATITINLLKNGTTVLSSNVSLSNANASFAIVLAGISVGAYVVDDVFEVSVTATAGGGTLGLGLFAEGTFEELAA